MAWSKDNLWIIYVIAAIAFCVICGVFYWSYRQYKKNSKKFKEERRTNNVPGSTSAWTYDDEYPESWFNQLTNNNEWMTMLEFERVQNTFQGTEGCYVIKNNTKDKIYVGQSKNLAWRVPQHFGTLYKGEFRGNKQVYEDFKNRDTFLIMLIPIKSNMPDINQLEAGLIRFYKSDSYYGYNRSLGRNGNNNEVIRKKALK